MKKLQSCSCNWFSLEMLLSTVAHQLIISHVTCHQLQKKTTSAQFYQYLDKLYQFGVDIHCFFPCARASKTDTQLVAQVTRSVDTQHGNLSPQELNTINAIVKAR